MNFDQIRTGRTMELQAQIYAENAIRNSDPENAGAEYQAAYDERLKLLIESSNKVALTDIRASSVAVTDENKDEPVLRFTLKPGISEKQARAVIGEREAALTSEDFDGDAMKLDAIVAKAFETHELTNLEASKRPELKRTLSDCLPFGGVSFETQDELPPITAENFQEKLKEKGMTHSLLAKQIGVHHKIAESWKREGVPQEYLLEVRTVLS